MDTTAFPRRACWCATKPNPAEQSENAGQKIGTSFSYAANTIESLLPFAGVRPSRPPRANVVCFVPPPPPPPPPPLRVRSNPPDNLARAVCLRRHPVDDLLG